jgi:predicted nucleotidyltransferase
MQLEKIKAKIHTIRGKQVMLDYNTLQKSENYLYDIIIITFDIKMITLLRTGYGKIMQLFYLKKDTTLHFREIARQAGMAEPSAYRFLNRLEKEQILSSKREGNLKKYSVSKTIKAFFLFQAFDLERFERLPEIRKNAIKRYIDALPEKPIFAILFGSTAKNTYKDGSDIDIFIVANKRIQSDKAEKETDALTTMRISTFQITFKSFLTELKMKDDKVLQSAINSGFPLLNHIYYYEVLHNERI